MFLRLFALVLLLVGCAPQSAQPTMVAVTEETIVTPPAPAPGVTPTGIAASTAEATARVPVTLNVRLPEPLAPIDNQDAADLLSEQISAFQAANDDIVVDFRLKKAQDVGGIMATLKAANLVAPGALPDLTLLRRSDM